ncbi:MAG: AAA family ATPase [Candidatus Microthrix sp.]|nr:AAA family ATPase [Candidatus Microthrix sp.]
MAVQGPPGTGKTYSGAHLILELIRSGQRVGITAFSHSAVDNLLRAVVEVFGECGESELLRAVRRGSEPRSGGLPGVTYAGGNRTCANSKYNLVAGTTWPFAGKDLRGSPVDTLIVDEAGQLSLADALAASCSATNLILLGDPLQLAQVSKASHPNGSGASVLQHVLGDDATMPVERGVLLEVTRRMHPDVCRFISERVYDGRVLSITRAAHSRRRSSEPGCGGCRFDTRGAPPSRWRRPRWSPTKSAGCWEPTGPTSTAKPGRWKRRTSWSLRPTTTR